jgi:segregation and condensation protein B
MPKLDRMERNVEAILFASGDPIEIEKIADVLMIDLKTVKNLIEKIRDRYFQQRSPLDIVTLGAACQMCTLPEYADVVRPALELRRTTALSPASLEVLAVIAYNQPVTRSFVDQVRGVDCASIVRSLTDKGLIEEAGRLNIPGKPISYRTTANFLRVFGLESVEQLPTLPELPPEDDMEKEPEVEGQIDLFEEE